MLLQSITCYKMYSDKLAPKCNYYTVWVLATKITLKVSVCRNRIALIIADNAWHSRAHCEKYLPASVTLSYSCWDCWQCGKLWLWFIEHQKLLHNLSCRLSFKPLAEFHSSLRNYLKLLTKTFSSKSISKMSIWGFAGQLPQCLSTVIIQIQTIPYSGVPRVVV